MQKKIGVLLSGCGVFDGTEIHEAVLTLLCLDRIGAKSICIAPNISQTDVIDHLENNPTNETRNVLTESARIARGDINDLEYIDYDELDALILPGGLGAVKNLSTLALEDLKPRILPQVEKILTFMFEKKNL